MPDATNQNRDTRAFNTHWAFQDEINDCVMNRQRKDHVMTSGDIWKAMDQVLLNAKLSEIAEEMQGKLAEDKARARAEGVKRGNAAFYPVERIRQEERRAGEWAEKEYEAALKVWETQGFKPSRAFYRAVYENLLAPLFGTRKGTVNADLRLEDQRTRKPGHSTAAQGAFARSMDKLSSRWNRKLEIATREQEYALQGKQRSEPSAESAGLTTENIKKRWDVFISHASEDKDDIARPLAQALRNNGYRVWYDEFALTVGDSLRKSIDHGLAQSDFGVVILSRRFFEKHWPEQELNGLAGKELEGRKVILPVWHKVTAEEVRNFSPMLADRLGVKTDKGVLHVVEQLELALKKKSAANK